MWELQDMLAHSAAQQRTIGHFLADLDAWQASRDTPSAMLAAKQHDACNKLADLAQRRAKMADIRLECHEVYLEYCQLERRLDGVAAEQAAIDGRAWLAQHQAWLPQQQDGWI